ncbi:MAG TPA: tetratricopeptide repeat protein [Thermoanaerobaculia bacterium]|nr:tetratricopeptide repeat protein [Thermoanaerobaculia bacterium]HUM30956.1 tetratricopeptide repeat protein [Thermoanaerobaculia bacterium]HXK69384.1 tetratricopeptide repeat protein [Thermoanaerobaculia bacterium]
MSLCSLAQEEAGDLLVIPGETNVMTLGKTRFEDRLNELWQQALSSVNTGNLPDAELDIKQMLLEARHYDIDTLGDFSWAAIIRYLEEMQEGNRLEAQFFHKAAIDLGQGLPEPAMLSCAESAREHSWGPMIKEFFDGFAIIMTRDMFFLPVLGNFLYFALTSLYILAFFLAILLFFKYIARVMHDVQEFFQMRVQAFLKTILAMAFFVLPLILGFDLRWQVVFLFVILFGYAAAKERIIIIAFLVIGILTPPALYLLRQEYRLRTSAIYEAASAIKHGELVYNYIGNIETINNILGEDTDLMYMIANLYQKSGDTANAIAYYQKTVDADPRNKEAYLNLGNLYFWENQFESSIDKYKKAIQADSAYIPAYFNLYSALNNNYQYDEAQQIMAEGQAINARAFNRIFNHPPQNDVVGAFFTTGDARKKYHKINREGKLRGKEIRGHALRDSLLSNLVHPLVIMCVLGLIGAVMLDRFRVKKGGYAGVCTKCGRTFCHLCKRSSESQTYCSQCIHIYIKKDGVPLEVKVKKINEVKRYLRFNFYIQKLLNIIFPGSVSILKESPVKGILLLFTIFLLLAFIFLRPLFPILHIQVLTAEFLRKGAMGIIAILWLASNVRNLLEKGGV